MENQEAIVEFMRYVRSLDWQMSEMVRTFRELVGSLDILVESVDHIDSSLAEIRNLQNLMRDDQHRWD